MLTTEIRELLRESAPIAGILLFWSFFGKLLPPVVTTSGPLIVGVLMAVLYVGMRGPELANSLEISPLTERGDLFEANVIVAAAAGGWFLLGSFLWLVVTSFPAFRSTTGHVSVVNPGLGILTDLLPFVFVGTGVLTAGLYVVAVGVARFGSRSRPADRSSPESVTE